MTAKRWSLILIATVLILALALAGCGLTSDWQLKPTVVPSPTAAVPTPTEQPKHQAPNGSSEA